MDNLESLIYKVEKLEDRVGKLEKILDSLPEVEARALPPIEGEDKVYKGKKCDNDCKNCNQKGLTFCSGYIKI